MTSKFRLSCSNIAWEKENDERIYTAMCTMGFSGLEIAPTRTFSEHPYDKLNEARLWAENIKEQYGFSISSIQSIWRGVSEKLFDSEEKMLFLIEYTKKAVDFAACVNCGNIVFGCPSNRSIPGNSKYSDIEDRSLFFFRAIGDYAAKKGTTIGLEANPVIYHTNFINRTEEAVEIIRKVDSPGLKLNYDIGTVICNEEDIHLAEHYKQFINHVHISEPYLRKIKKRSIHTDLKKILSEGFDGFVSIEMGMEDDVNCVVESMRYISSVFG